MKTEDERRIVEEASGPESDQRLVWRAHRFVKENV